MIRRKLWATATCCLAVAATASGQGPASSARLGKPQDSDYTARGVAPNPGYPQFVPRNYGVATPSGHAALGTPQPASFAADTVEAPGTGPTPMPMPPGKAVPGAAPKAMPGVPVVPGTEVGAPTITSSPFVDGVMAGNPYAEPMPNAWFGAEYLYWRSKGVRLPALATSAPAGSAGTLDLRDTSVVLGGRDALDNWKRGFRLRGGYWLDQGSGIDVAFFTLGRLRDDGSVASGGTTGLFRPFLDTNGNVENSALVAFNLGGQTILSGRVGVQHASDLMGGEFNYRTGFMSGSGTRLDALIGYRYGRLRDTLAIETASVVRNGNGGIPVGTQVGTFDRFDALNRFHGAQIGVAGDWELGCVTFGFRASIAAGVNVQTVEINGNNGSILPNGTRAGGIGGLLALPTNIGTHDRTQFGILPEVGLTMGYQVSNNLRIFGGYNLLYWSNVARAGSQIDRVVNSTLIPDPTTGRAGSGGAARPTFLQHDSDYYAHGWTLGLEWRW